MKNIQHFYTDDEFTTIHTHSESRN